MNIESFFCNICCLKHARGTLLFAKNKVVENTAVKLCYTPDFAKKETLVKTMSKNYMYPTYCFNESKIQRKEDIKKAKFSLWLEISLGCMNLHINATIKVRHPGKIDGKKMRFETVFYLLNMSQKADTSGLCGTEYHVWDESLHVSCFESKIQYSISSFD